MSSGTTTFSPQHKSRACYDATSVQAHTPRDSEDLTNISAGSGKKEFKDRGYRFVNSTKGNDRIWANW